MDRRILDNLPAAAVNITTNHEVLYSTGFPIGGRSASGTLYLYNHVHMVIKYHQSSEYEGKRIVGFDVQPLSVANVLDPEDNTRIGNCNAETGLFDPHSVEPLPLLVTETEDRMEVSVWARRLLSRCLSPSAINTLL